MKERTPTWNCYTEIPEFVLFTDDEKALIKNSMTGLQRFVISDTWLTHFRLWADTQEQINEARAKLGKIVIKIIEDRKIQSDGSGDTRHM